MKKTPYFLRTAWLILLATPLHAASPLERTVNAAYATNDPARFREAAVALEDDLRRHPGNLANRKSLGFIYLDKLQEPQAALPHLEKVAQALPRDSGWWQMLARAYAGAGGREAAAEAYRHAAAHHPRDVWARYHLGRTLRELHRTREARAAFGEALALEPANPHVLLELAQLAHATGDDTRAARFADALLRADPHHAEAHALRGDLARADWNFSRARAEYAEAPQSQAAQLGLKKMREQQAHAWNVALYTFEDTDDLRQSGIFTSVSALMTGPVQISLTANERFFKKPPGEMVTRHEAGLTLDYRFDRRVQISAGISQFKTESLGRETGGNAALYVTPAPPVDAWLSYRHADPVNDSDLTARAAFTQNILATGLTLRSARNFITSLRASTADYSDGNTRRSALASLAYYTAFPAAPVCRLEYEWLDFDEQKSGYSSPGNYALLRPVLEFTPRITDWLKIEFHGEFPYVFGESEWGHGIITGPRFTFGDGWNVGLLYLNYEIPGGQTTWSGSGFKAEFSGRF